MTLPDKPRAKLTPDQINKLLTAFIAFVVTVATIFGLSVTTPPPAAPQGGQIGVQAIQRNGILCSSGETNCVDSRGGMNIIVYSDDGTTQKFKVTGSSGNTAVAGTLDVTGLSTLPALSTTNLTATTITATNLISQVVDFAGTNATVTNITGTLKTAAQPNITSLGTQGTLTATNATITTLNMAGGGSQVGAFRAGYTAAYTSTNSIAHGLGITPTACIPLFVSAPITVSVVSLDSTNFAFTTSANNIPMYWMCGK